MNIKKNIALIGLFTIMTVLIVSFQNAAPSSATSRIKWQDNFDRDSSATGLEITLLHEVPALRVLSVRKVRGFQESVLVSEPTHFLKFLNANGIVVKIVPFEVENEIFSAPLKNEAEVGSEHALNHRIKIKKQKIAISTELPFNAAQIQIFDNSNVLLDQHDIPDKGADAPNVPIQKINGDDFKKQLGTTGASVYIPKKLEFVLQLFGLTQNEARADSYHVDVVFIGDQYTSAQLSTFSSDVDRYVTKLLSIEPYKSQAAKYSFYKVANTTSLACAYDQANVRLLVCDNSKVTTAVNNSGIQYDKIAVLVNNSTYGGSGGGISVAYNGSWGPEVFVHEFGHSFAGLQDEYMNFTSNGSVTNKAIKNCFAGTPPAPEWSGVVENSSYYPECNYPNYYRSSISSVMRALDSFYFNAVSQNIINARTSDFICTVSAPQYLSASKGAKSKRGGSITLSWQAPATGIATKYRIYRNNVYIGYTTSLSYVNSSLKAGMYNYYVRAVDSMNRESANCNQVSITL